jgi:hypothetical protein
MKAAGLLLLLCCAGASIVAAEEETNPLAEKTVDVSPDGKFAMRLRFDQALNAKMIANEHNSLPGNDGLHSEPITEIDLVATATGEVVAKLADADQIGTHFNGVKLMWSSDSRWVTYSYGHPRFSYVTVYRREGEKFHAVAETEKLLRKHKGNVRNEYLAPVKWTKPGVLVLTQEAVLRGSGGYAATFTVAFSPSGKFKVVATEKTTDAGERKRR